MYVQKILIEISRSFSAESFGIGFFSTNRFTEWVYVHQFHTLKWLPIPNIQKELHGDF